MKIQSEYKLTRGSEEAAGYDIRAVITSCIVLAPMESVIINTGVKIALDKGYEAQVRGRSGMWFNDSISVGQLGTIDSDYRGEIKVKLINLGNEFYTINKGDRIAQIVIAKHEVIDFEYCKIEVNTNRGDTGFGNSGIS